MRLVFIYFLNRIMCTLAFENLAFGRPAWQENDWPGQPIDWGAAKAVDGKYSDRSAIGTQCTQSAGGKETATWGVDLQSVVSISYINIYYRTDNIPSPSVYVTRFAGFFLYVSNTTSKDDGKLCFHEIQNVNGTPTEDQRINCSVHGRYVIYYNERRQGVTYPSYYSQHAFNELCEVEVYGCAVTGYYGDNCSQSCPEKCKGQQCDAVTGNCVNGCVPGYQGLHCSYLNLALRKPAWQQHNWPYTPVAWGAAKAVDGKYSDRSAGGNQCTISDGRQTATLRVDLESVVSISHINIYYRTDNAPSPGAYYDRFAGFFLYVSNTTSKDDGYLCFHEIQRVNGTPTENQAISCPVHGRYVIYYNERGNPNVTYPSYYSHSAYNEVCELEVYGCPNPGYYGKYCDKLCPKTCQEGRCTITTGECLGCIPGYQGPMCSQICGKHTYGPECSLSCGNCSDGETCHHVNGTCPRGCSEGMEGDKCQTACNTGYYGKDCKYECSEKCGASRRCNRFTGECEGGCQQGWRGELCGEECEARMYGVNCNQSCGHCLNDSNCHHVNGTCMNGCTTGYKGLLCIEECNPGYYGINCKQECGEECFVTRHCNRFNGMCDGGCQPGWKGLRCDKKCDDGMYGVNCSQSCGHCRNDTQCHHINGACLEGCSSGYEGSLCINVCRQSAWGENCIMNCSTDCVNQICHHKSRICIINTKSQRSDSCNCDYTVTIISILVAVLIVITGSILNFLIWRRIQRKAMDLKTIGRNDNSKGFSAVDIADQHIGEHKITSGYAELGALDHQNAYDELHHYAKDDETM